jgi:prevent-host-death family protein
MIYVMKTMVISEFKAKCIAVLKEAQRVKQPLVVTLRGKPLARIEPIVGDTPQRRLGAMKGQIKVFGDIVHADTTDDWEHDCRV